MTEIVHVAYFSSISGGFCLCLQENLDTIRCPGRSPSAEEIGVFGQMEPMRRQELTSLFYTGPADALWQSLREVARFPHGRFDEAS